MKPFLLFALVSLLIAASFVGLSTARHHDHQHRQGPVSNTFIPANLTRFSYESDCPEPAKNADGAPLCNKGVYTFDKEMLLVSFTHKKVTTHARITAKEFADLREAASFLHMATPQPQIAPHGQNFRLPKRTIIAFWNNAEITQEIRSEMNNDRDAVFKNIPRTSEAAKFIYSSAQATPDQLKLDMTVSQLVADKEFIELPASINQIDNIKWVRVAAKSNKEASILERYDYYLNSRVKHVTYVDDIKEVTPDTVPTKKLYTEFGQVSSVEMLRSLFQRVIDNNILFADSVYGHQDAGDRGVVLQVEWTSKQTQEKFTKNITIWELQPAPVVVQNMELRMRALKADIKYDDAKQPEDPDASSERFHMPASWSYISYGFSLCIGLIALFFMVRSVRKRAADDQDFEALEKCPEDQVKDSVYKTIHV